MAPCTIGIIVNRTKPHADAVARRLVETMLRHEAKILLDASNVVPATLDYVLARMMARKYVHLDFVSGRYHA